MTEIKYMYDGAKMSKRPEEKLASLTRLREQLEDYNHKVLGGQKVKFDLPFREEKSAGVDRSA